MKVFGIIPARYASSRFPGKPLARLDGCCMIEWVYRRAIKAFDAVAVAVATDDERIAGEVARFGGRALMTSPAHQSGTDRCAEAMLILQRETGVQADVVVNIQGDEPFIDPTLLARMVACFDDASVQITTTVTPFECTADLLNPNHVKVVITASSRAVYFSRLPIPCMRGVEQNEWINHHTYYRHLGLYAYRADVLMQLSQLPQSPLEIAESLEQNRWIENDYHIHVIHTTGQNIAIDTLEDLQHAHRWIQTSGVNCRV